MCRGKKIKRKCFCGNEFMARVSDIKRGWGKTCSKSCAKKKLNKNKSYKRYRIKTSNEDDLPRFSNAHQFCDE